MLEEGALVTVSCAEGDTGYIYDGLLEDRSRDGASAASCRRFPVKIMMNVGNPQLAFEFQALPNEGVGLARLEFIINNNIGVHPKAILDYPNVDADLKKAVESVARGHASPRAFYVDKLAEGIATIAAAFWPKPVIVRLSDFKSNEYKQADRRLALRARGRKPDARLSRRLALHRRVVRECFRDGVRGAEARARRDGPDQRRDHGAVRAHAQRGRARGRDAGGARPEARTGGAPDGSGLRVIMMCEVPSNADPGRAVPRVLRRLVDRLERPDPADARASTATRGWWREGFDERDPAVKALLARAIAACRARGKYIGICGQGPTDHADFAEWLVEQGIESISLNPDTVVETWQPARPALR